LKCRADTAFGPAQGRLCPPTYQQRRDDAS